MKNLAYTAGGEQIAWKAGRAFVKEWLWLSEKAKRGLKSEKNWREIGLRRHIGDLCFKRFKSLVDKKAEVFCASTRTKRDKFDKLCKTMERLSLAIGKFCAKRTQLRELNGYQHVKA